jgi:hypothetical protein
MWSYMLSKMEVYCILYTELVRVKNNVFRFNFDSKRFIFRLM